MENTNLTEKATIVPVVKEIRSILDTARSNVARQVNNELLHTYWNIGRNRQISRRMDTHGIIVVERFATFHYY